MSNLNPATVGMSSSLASGANDPQTPDHNAEQDPNTVYLNDDAVNVNPLGLNNNEISPPPKQPAPEIKQARVSYEAMGDPRSTAPQQGSIRGLTLAMTLTTTTTSTGEVKKLISLPQQYDRH
jgi:hypothetical protein